MLLYFIYYNNIMQKQENLKNNFIFDEKTICIINEQINYYSFLKSTLKLENITKISNINGITEINIKMGENVFRYIPYNHCIISYQDIPMILLVKNMLEFTPDKIISLYSELNSVELNSTYLNFIKNSVILGYLYILNYSHIIDFNCIDDLNLVTQKIVNMVYEYKLN